MSLQAPSTTPSTRTSDVEFIDLRYNLIVDEDASKFKWLDMLLLYLPAFIRKHPSGARRSRTCLRVIVILSALLFVFWGSMLAANYIAMLHKLQSSLVLALSALSLFLYTAQRILSFIYYFWFFDFPWYSDSEILRDLQFIDNRKGYR